MNDKTFIWNPKKDDKTFRWNWEEESAPPFVRGGVEQLLGSAPPKIRDLGGIGVSLCLKRIDDLERENAEMKAFIGDLLGERVRVYRVLQGDGGRTIWSIQPESIYHKYPWLEAYLDR